MEPQLSSGDPSEDSGDTREALLDAAELLFARNGIERASLRAITREAGANLASVHYHFGSKDALIQAVFARRLGPINRERIERLTELERLAGGDAVPIGDILRAFLEPVMEMLRRGSNSEVRTAHDLARMVVQTLSNPEGPARDIVLDEFREVKERFLAALARALPELPAEVLHWRFHFAIGAMVHTVSSGYLVHEISRGPRSALDVEGTTERLIEFLAAGLSCPIEEEG